MRPSLFAGSVLLATLAACSQSSPPAVEQTAAPPAPAPLQIAAPQGAYQLDPSHSSLLFRVNHVGVSTYVARFTRYEVKLDLDPANLAASSVTAAIDSASVRTDFSGDYRAHHPDSKFQTWDEDLAKSDKFFNAGVHPQILFHSTRVEQTGPGALQITGDLTLLGQTHPVSLEASLVGSSAAHPFGGGGAIGFSATGSFQRSTFGMDHLVKPPLVGDTVTIQFEGEFRQMIAPVAAASS